MTTAPARAQRFTGKRVVVTGAAGGVGNSVSELFRAEGATVFGGDITAADGVVSMDLTDDDSVAAFAAAAVSELGGVDVLCNVAGMQAFMHFADMSAGLIRKHLDVNTVGPLILTQALLPALMESKGNVVSITSISAMMGQPYNVAYCASKAGLLLGMRALAVEFASKGIRVNCISPGGINTAMTEKAAHDLPHDIDWNLISKSQGVIPGFMPPSDIAEAVLFLASDAASSITAANLVVDRGVIW